MATISVSLPADGDTIDVADYNTPVTTIVNAINGNLDNDNIAAAAAIAGTKLADNAVTNAKVADDAITTAKINDGAVTSAKVAVGMPVQMSQVTYGTVDSTTALIPDDTSIPQNTEGKEVMSLAFTPKSATNVLVVEVWAFVANSTSNDTAVALFVDSTADAVAVGTLRSDTGAVHGTVNYKYAVVAGSTSARTYKVRIGGSGAGTAYLNGKTASTAFGTATQKSGICITEYKAS